MWPNMRFAALARCINETMLYSLADPLADFHGHFFQLTTVPYFPYVAYSTDTPEKGTTVTLQDSLNVRILHTFAAALNFT